MQGGIDSPEQWLDAHGDALYRYALVRLRDAHKAEEAVQETLLAALQARERFSGGASVRTWLIGILKHKILDQFRREARELNLGDSQAQAAEDDQVVAGEFLIRGSLERGYRRLGKSGCRPGAGPVLGDPATLPG